MTQTPAITDVERAIRLWCADNAHVLADSEVADLANRIASLPTPNVALSEEQVQDILARHIVGCSFDDMHSKVNWLVTKEDLQATAISLLPHLKANAAPQDTAPLNGGIRQYRDVSGTFTSTSQERLLNNCDGGVALQGGEKLQEALKLLWFFLPLEEPDPHSNKGEIKERNKRWHAACKLYQEEISCE